MSEIVLDAPEVPLPDVLPRLGALEQQVMEVLWDCPDELCTRRVLERLTETLAYTTVATVLTNLTRKGLLDRTSTLRSWAYRPRLTRAQYGAGVALQCLGATSDREGALRELVHRLDAPCRAALRAALDDV